MGNDTVVLRESEKIKGATAVLKGARVTRKMGWGTNLSM